MSETDRTVVLIASACAILALGWGSVQSTDWLAYNPTTSAPKGWYVVEHPEVLHVDDYVLARLPADAALLADNRRYLPKSVPILKRIGAVGYQIVCAVGKQIYIDDEVVGEQLTRDGAGRELNGWSDCRALKSDELFLLSLTNPASFDSRYFGPVQRINVIGKVRPLWTW